MLLLSRLVQPASPPLRLLLCTRELLALRTILVLSTTETRPFLLCDFLQQLGLVLRLPLVLLLFWLMLSASLLLHFLLCARAMRALCLVV